jgi:hypothetical protein
MNADRQKWPWMERARSKFETHFSYFQHPLPNDFSNNNNNNNNNNNKKYDEDSPLDNSKEMRYFSSLVP